MLRFMGGPAIGLLVGLHLGSMPEFTQRPSEIGQIPSWSGTRHSGVDKSALLA
jgi:hypothetical protein